jgi:cytochrome c oxidase subunit II
MNELLRVLLFLPPQRSTVAEEIDKLHYFVILVTIAGATLVTLTGAALLIRYRRRAPVALRMNPDGARQVPLFLEVIAMIILFALFVMWWVIGSRQYVDLRVAPANAMDVYVTAKQWMWKFAYPEGQSSLTVLYVPVGRPVKLVMTSRDVIHSFYVPDFRVKQDVIPGRFTTAWFAATAPGTYEILCAEYCGQGHSTMRGQVVALSPADYERWLSGTELGQPLVREGERVAAEQGCLRCHTTDGTPHIGPTWAGLYGAVVPLADGGSATVDEAYLTESMMDPAVKVHRGYWPVMPSYLGRISPAETAAIVELIKSLREVAPAGPEGQVYGPMDGGKTP